MGMSSDVQREAKRSKASTCSFCGRALGKEYFFTCHVCGANYCYIHMYRHSRAHRAQPSSPIVTKQPITA